MKPRIFISVVIAVAALILAGFAIADSGTKLFKASLDGYHENPSISTNGTGSFRAHSTNGTGSFRATLNPTGDELKYELQYSGLEGGNTLFAHVHIGQIGVAGG